MSFPKILVLLTVSCLFVNCQDSKSQKNIPEKRIKSPSEINPAEKVVIPGSGFKEFDFSKIKTVSQEQLKSFLYEYGKQHPETRIKITTEYGDITVELFTDTPLHRANFIRLVKLGYFNTSFFHRVDEGFVIQGGNSDKPITQKIRGSVGDFLIPNESSTSHPHDRGAFSMAKYSEQNISAASSPFEFFIVQSENGAHHLDGKHTVFGKVVDGMNVVDAINKVKTDDLEWPLKNVQMEIGVIH